MSALAFRCFESFGLGARPTLRPVYLGWMRGSMIFSRDLEAVLTSHKNALQPAHKVVPMKRVSQPQEQDCVGLHRRASKNTEWGPFRLQTGILFVDTSPRRTLRCLGMRDRGPSLLVFSDRWLLCYFQKYIPAKPDWP